MSADQTGYVPDPEADTAMVIDAFFGALCERFAEAHDLDLRLRERHAQLLGEQQHRILDEPSRYNLAMTLAVLAAYRELEAEHDRLELLAVLRAAFVEPMEPFVRDATRSVLDHSDDAFAAMVTLTRQRESEAFGTGFVFSHPEDDADSYTSQVERCFYHDVLVANDAPELTPVFCAFDGNWIDAIDPLRDGFEFERPTTIGTGGASCPFRFRRTRAGS